MAVLLKCSRRLGGEEDEISVGEGEETKGRSRRCFCSREKRGIYAETRKEGEPNHDSVIFQPEEASQRITARAPFPLSGRELGGKNFKLNIDIFFSKSLAN